MSQNLSVSHEAVLAIVQAQRNTAFDELAKAQVVVDQLVAERDSLAAEVKELRGAAQVVSGEVDGG
jgi:cell division protein FtsB